MIPLVSGVFSEGFEGHLPAFEGLGAEFTAVRAISGVWDPDIRMRVMYEQTGGNWDGGQLTLLLVPQQMGLALELLATLIAGR